MALMKQPPTFSFLCDKIGYLEQCELQGSQNSPDRKKERYRSSLIPLKYHAADVAVTWLVTLLIHCKMSHLVTLMIQWLIS